MKGYVLVDDRQKSVDAIRYKILSPFESGYIGTTVFDTVEEALSVSMLLVGFGVSDRLNCIPSDAFFIYIQECLEDPDFNYDDEVKQLEILKNESNN